MTNEEAIRLVDDRMCYGRGKWSRHHQPVIDEYWQAGEMAIKALEQPKTGKWIKITKGAMHEKYMCSACGRTIEEDGIERLVPIKYPFCHCGAKMEGAANND